MWKSVKCRQKLAKPLVGTFELSYPKHSKLFFDFLENSSRQESVFFNCHNISQKEIVHRYPISVQKKR